ncbi:MAG TPA: hypothetical protein VFW45_05075 [Candidatus Polarisedimenticolia bacterium]|nr:hypothetical protein [Candidatus Polarisedimenticolia bacterium]
MRRALRLAVLAALLLLIGFSSPSPGKAAELQCAVCGQAITGRYLEEDGRAYHEACYARTRAARCAVCGEAIMGPRIESEGKSYHEKCYREAVLPRCAVCGQLIEGTYLKEGGKSYHPQCHRTKSAKCAVCGEPLEGSFLADPWGNPFHARHGEKILCPFCSRVMAVSTTGGSVISSASGMRICRLCDRRGVSGRGKAETSLERVRQRMADLFPVPEGSFAWELVDRERLDSLLTRGPHARNELGLTVGISQRRGREESKRIRVYLLSGLPDWLFDGVAAHEMAHVWQNLRRLEDLPLDKAEGSAELASYLVLDRGGTPEGRIKIQEMESSDDPAYGIGFRKAMKVSMRGQSMTRLHRVLEGEKGWPDRP